MALARRLAAAAAILTALAVPAAGQAAQINVTTTVDGNGGTGSHCSLREAIRAANDHNAGPGGDCAAGTSGPDTINLPAGTYTLDDHGTGEDAAASGDLDVTENLTIIGAGATTTIVDGDAADRVFDFSQGTSELRDLTVRNGKTPSGTAGAADADKTGPASDSVGGDGGSVTDSSDGGGIRMAGSLRLTRVVVSGNHAGDGGAGGASGAGGDGDVDNGVAGVSTGGRGGNGANGGGVANVNGALTAEDSRITGNTAGDGGDGGKGGQGGNGFGAGFAGGASTGGNGGDGGNGGGIFESLSAGGGDVHLTHTVVSGNSAGSGGDGGDGGAGGAGGSSATLQAGPGGSTKGGDGGNSGGSGGVSLLATDIAEITDSTFRGNTAGSGGNGGNGGTAGAAGVSPVTAAGGDAQGGGGGSGATGGGLELAAQHQTLTRDAFVDNSAGAGGAGGAAGTSGAGTPNGSTAGGNGGEGGPGGGLALEGGRADEAMSNVTIASNHGGDGGVGGSAGTGGGTDAAGAGAMGGGGGGLEVSGGFDDWTVTQLTIAANAAGAPGASVTNSGTPGGVLNDSVSKTLTFQNTVIASNTAPQCLSTTAGGFPDGPNNLVFPNDSTCGAATGGDPKLSPLADHGGLTPTMTLLAGSAAVNAAGTGAPCTLTDQRGVTRPKGSACDIGAVERSLPAAATAGANLIRAQQASVAGTVNPGQLPASYFFRYGKTKAYGSKTPAAGAGTGDANVLALATLRKLAPNTTYHYRLVGRNPDGTVTGVDRSFRTKPLPFAGVRILSEQATVKNGRAPVKVSCPLPSSLTRCAGSLALTTRVKKHGKTTTVKLGTTSFTVATGKTATVKVKLTDAALKLVKAKGKLATEATARTTDARGGKQKVTKRGMTLNAPTKG
jgi:CSLREA domain-containing protein